MIKQLKWWHYQETLRVQRTGNKFPEWPNLHPLLSTWCGRQRPRPGFVILHEGINISLWSKNLKCLRQTPSGWLKGRWELPLRRGEWLHQNCFLQQPCLNSFLIILPPLVTHVFLHRHWQPHLVRVKGEFCTNKANVFILVHARDFRGSLWLIWSACCHKRPSFWGTLLMSWYLAGKFPQITKVPLRCDKI